MLRWLLGCTLGAELLLLRRFGERRELYSSSPEPRQLEWLSATKGRQLTGKQLAFIYSQTRALFGRGVGDRRLYAKKELSRMMMDDDVSDAGQGERNYDCSSLLFVCFFRSGL